MRRKIMVFVAIATIAMLATVFTSPVMNVSSSDYSFSINTSQFQMHPKTVMKLNTHPTQENNDFKVINSSLHEYTWLSGDSEFKHGERIGFAKMGGNLPPYYYTTVHPITHYAGISGNVTDLSTLNHTLQHNSNILKKMYNSWYQKNSGNAEVSDGMWNLTAFQYFEKTDVKSHAVLEKIARVEGELGLLKAKEYVTTPLKKSNFSSNVDQNPDIVDANKTWKVNLNGGTFSVRDERIIQNGTEKSIVRYTPLGNVSIIDPSLLVLIIPIKFSGLTVGHNYYLLSVYYGSNAVALYHQIQGQINQDTTWYGAVAGFEAAVLAGLIAWASGGLYGFLAGAILSAIITFIAYETSSALSANLNSAYDSSFTNNVLQDKQGWFEYALQYTNLFYASNALESDAWDYNTQSWLTITSAIPKPPGDTSSFMNMVNGLSSQYGQNNWFTVTQTLNDPTASASGGGCILNGTMVSVSRDHSVPVQDLRTGDHILSYNPVTSKFFKNEITNITVTHTSSVFNVDNGLLYVSGSDDQPIYALLPNGTEEWIMVGQLTTYDRVLNPLNGTWVPVTSIQTLAGNFTVYEIDGANSFYQGGHLRFTYLANGILLDKKANA